MRCPIDGSELAMMDRQGIEVDYCPKCRGVWLDRGELDKIIERSADDHPSPQQSERTLDREDDARRRDNRPYGPQPQPYRKKKSLLSELFDF